MVQRRVRVETADRLVVKQRAQEHHDGGEPNGKRQRQAPLLLAYRLAPSEGGGQRLMADSGPRFAIYHFEHLQSHRRRPPMRSILFAATCLSPAAAPANATPASMCDGHVSEIG